MDDYIWAIIASAISALILAVFIGFCFYYCCYGFRKSRTRIVPATETRVVRSLPMQNVGAMQSTIITYPVVPPTISPQMIAPPPAPPPTISYPPSHQPIQTPIIMNSQMAIVQPPVQPSAEHLEPPPSYERVMNSNSNEYPSQPPFNPEFRR